MWRRLSRRCRDCSCCDAAAAADECHAATLSLSVLKISLVISREILLPPWPAERQAAGLTSRKSRRQCQRKPGCFFFSHLIRFRKQLSAVLLLGKYAYCAIWYMQCLTFGIKRACLAATSAALPLRYSLDLSWCVMLVSFSLSFFFCLVRNFFAPQVRGGTVRHGGGLGLPERLPVHPAAVAPAPPSHAAQDPGRGPICSPLAGDVSRILNVHVTLPVFFFSLSVSPLSLHATQHTKARDAVQSIRRWWVCSGSRISSFHVSFRAFSPGCCIFFLFQPYGQIDATPTPTPPD